MLERESQPFTLEGSSEDRARRESIRVLLLQYVATERSIVGRGAEIGSEFEQHLQSLSRLGLLKCVATLEEITYEITDAGLQFLEGYRHLERDS